MTKLSALQPRLNEGGNREVRSRDELAVRDFDSDARQGLLCFLPAIESSPNLLSLPIEVPANVNG
jgi:hypothetical protein